MDFARRPCRMGRDQIPLMRCSLLIFFCSTLIARSASVTTASNNFAVTLSPPVAPGTLQADSPFGINNAFQPDTRDLDARLAALQQAGIKWGRQDFTWRRIEKAKGEYDWSGYDTLVEKCRETGLSILGNLTYQPAFYDLRSHEAVEAYAAFARAAATRYAGKVDHWQIWNEPNLGFLKGDVETYAKFLSAAG